MADLVRSGTTASGLPWRIRPTAAEDAAAIVVLRDMVALEPDRICAEPGAHSAAEESLMLAGLLSEGGLSLTLEVDGAVAGHLVCMRRVPPYERHVAELSIIVAAEHRGIGLGRTLIETAIAWAPSVGVAKIALSVFPENTPAIGLYLDMGFAEEGRLRNQVRAGDCERDLLVMGLAV